MDPTNQNQTNTQSASGGTQQQDDLPLSPEIRRFLETILDDAGMTNLDDEMREEMINQLYVRLDNFLMTAIIDHMPAENLEEFISIQEKGATKQEIEVYMKQHIPNAQEVSISAFAQFRQLYLNNVAVARNAPAETVTSTPAKNDEEEKKEEEEK